MPREFLLQNLRTKYVYEPTGLRGRWARVLWITVVPKKRCRHLNLGVRWKISLWIWAKDPSTARHLSTSLALSTWVVPLKLMGILICSQLSMCLCIWLIKSGPQLANNECPWTTHTRESMQWILYNCFPKSLSKEVLFRRIIITPSSEILIQVIHWNTWFLFY